MTHYQRPKQYGSWSSPLTPGELAQARKFSDVGWEQGGQTLVWREERGESAVLVCQSDPCNASRDVTQDINIRARVGYGGGDFTVGSATVFFVSENGLYRQPLDGGSPDRLVPACADFASPALSPDGSCLACVCSWGERDCLVLASTSGLNWPVQLDSSTGFYMQPCWHPEGRMLAWVGWNEPNMPWDGTALYLAELDTGRGPLQAKSIRIVVGDPAGAIAIFQPSFSPDGRFLAYVSDETGWSNIHLLDLETGSTRLLVQEEAEHAVPAWAQGLRTYDWSGDGREVFYIRSKNGFQTVHRQRIRAKRPQKIAGELSAYSAFRQIAVSRSTGEMALIASSPCLSPRVITCNTRGQVRIRSRSGSERIMEYCSQPRPVHLKTEYEGTDCFGLYYPPSNPAFRGDGLPPAVIRIHGGPTGQYVAEYRADTQFLTSRGYGVFELNYRGSSGYGRAFSQLLQGNWGIRDVEDVHEAGRYLIAQRLADPRRLIIMGASAGGYTVLRAMISYPGYFRAGVCLYGVSNLMALARDTHRFERHYLDRLVGKLPDEADKYRQLSPLFFADRIRDPLALFHGEEDKVVPRTQSDRIVFNLAQHGVPHLYRVYPGEGHGWRKPETIKDFYQQLETFLLEHVFGA
jgi:dipeptidyl aminopeptidase/acylaminoacyl peptidase